MEEGPGNENPIAHSLAWPDLSKPKFRPNVEKPWR
jgi:hypothetical protein